MGNGRCIAVGSYSSYSSVIPYVDDIKKKKHVNILPPSLDPVVCMYVCTVHQSEVKIYCDEIMAAVVL